MRVDKNYIDYDDFNGESTEFGWNIFPGFTTLQLCDKINDLLSNLGQTPATSTGRILFMSMFSDIFCDRENNKYECLKNAEFVKTFAKRFGTGQWSFIGPSSEKKWYFSENSPQKAWDHVAEDMLLEFAKSGHPIFRATTNCPGASSKVKEKGKCPYTSPQIKIQLIQFIASFFQWISSVFTEQWQLYAKIFWGPSRWIGGTWYIDGSINRSWQNQNWIFFAQRESHEWPNYLAAVHSRSWIAFTRKRSE